MSLILRRKCQEILDGVNLGDFHVSIDANKHLTVVGPCGKTLFTVTGITFSRVVPTTKELDYAVELLAEFFISNKVKLTNMLNALAAYNKVKDTKIVDSNKFSLTILRSDWLEHSTPTGYIVKYVTQVTETNPLKYYGHDSKTILSSCTFKMMLDLNFTPVSYDIDTVNYNLANLTTLVKNKALKKEMIKYAMEQTVVVCAQVNYATALADLQTCDI